MSYVKLASDGSIEQYPYTLTDLKLAHKNVSFPTEITPEIEAEYGLAPVARAESPSLDHTKNFTLGVEQLADGSFTEIWVPSNATPQEIAERTSYEDAFVRDKRNSLLKESDWTQLSDSPADSVAWATYRQELREIPQQAGFPWAITWPIAPA